MSRRVISMRERSRDKIQRKGKPTPSFSKAAEEFLLVQKGRGNRPATLSHYAGSIKKIKKFLAWHSFPEDFESMSEFEIAETGGAINCKAFNSKTIEASFRRFLLDVEEVSEVTVATYFRDYRAIAYWMMDEDIILPRQISFQHTEGDIKSCYTDKELSKLLKKPEKNCTFAAYRSWVAIHWMLGTGNRISTVCNIKIKDIDFEDGMININVQKNQRKHRIPLDPKLKTVLLEYIDEWLTDYSGNYISPYLFPSSYTQNSNAPISRYGLSQGIAEYNLSRGVNKTSAHLFRHTFTKSWILHNGDLHSLQKILGHSTLDMVTKYANLWGEDLKPKVEQFSVLATHQQKNTGRMIQRKRQT